MANVEIKIVAKDETGTVIKDVNEDLEGLGENAGIALDPVDKLAIGLSGVNAALGIAREIFAAGEALYGSLITDTIAAADEVSHLSDLMGDSPENASKLREAGNIAGIGIGTIETALFNMAKNGLDPSLDNIINLADEYNNLKEPEEKAELLIKNFGGAAEEMARLLGLGSDAIIQIGDDASMIFSEENLAEIEAHKQAVGELTGQWDALKMKIGMEVMPALTSFFEVLNEGMSAQKGTEEAMRGLDEALASGKVTRDEYSGWMLQLLDRSLTASERLEIATAALNTLNETPMESKDADYYTHFEIDDPYGLYGYEIYDKTVTYKINFEYNNMDRYGHGLEQRAHGGIIQGMAHAAGGYIVGEVGPEPFFPAENGRILSNTEARNAMKEGGGRGDNMTVIIQTPFNFADRQWAERELTPLFRDIMRQERA